MAATQLRRPFRGRQHKSPSLGHSTPAVCWSKQDLVRAILALHLLLSPLLFCTGCVGVFEYPKLALLVTVTVVLLAFGLHEVLERRMAVLRGAVAHLRRDPLSIGVILFLLSAVVSTATAISPHASLYGTHDSYAGLITIASYTVLYFATRASCRDSRDARLLMRGCMAAMVISATYALAQFAGLDPIIWTDVSDIGSYVRPFGTMGHPNFLAAYLVMTLPMALLVGQTFLPAWSRQECLLHRSTATSSWLKRCAFGLLVLMPLLVVVLTLSRGAWLALVCVGGVLLVGHARALLSRKAILVGGLLATAVGFVVVVGVVLWDEGGFGQSLRGRLRRLADGAGRAHIWEVGLALFRDRPWLGYGPDTFQLVFGTHRPADYGLVEWNATPARAHNELIHLLATQGLVGAAAAAVMLAGLALAAVRAWQRARAEDRLLVLVLAAAALGFLVTSLFSCTVVGCGTLFVTTLALLSRLATTDSTAVIVTPSCSSRSPRWLGAALWGGTAVVLYLVVARPFQANWLCAASDQIVDAQPHQAVTMLSRAVALQPANDIYWSKLGGALQGAAMVSEQPSRRQSLLTQARLALEQARRLEPRNAHHHLNLARLSAKLGCREEAFAGFEAALALDPHNAVFLVDAGEAALELGELGRVRLHARRCCELYPGYAQPHALLGRLALREQRYREATEHLAFSLTCDWHGEDATRLAAICQLLNAHFQLEQYEQVIEIGRWLGDVAPRLPEVRRQLSVARERLRQKQNARPTASVP